MSAECLREVFAELDMSSEALEILLSPSSPYCRLSTSGYAGTTQVIGSIAIPVLYGGQRAGVYHVTMGNCLNKH